jgi:hypothetical protein
MTVAQLLALQPGQRLLWDIGPGPDVGGVVVARCGPQLTILWDDGQLCTTGPDDDDLNEFAGCLEAIGGRPGEPDVPAILRVTE